MRRSCLLGVVALVVGVFPALPAGADHLGNFTCRASVVRVEDLALVGTVEPFVANAQEDPCETDSTGLLDDVALPGGLGQADAVSASTANNVHEDASAEAEVVGLVLTVPGLPVIEVEVLTASGAAGPCPDGDMLSGESTVVGLTVGGEAIEVPEDHFELDLGGLAILHLNEQIDEGDRLTVRAFWLEVPAASPVRTVVGDVIIAEAIVDVHGNPCMPEEPERFPGRMIGEGTVAEPGSPADTNNEGQVNPGTKIQHKFKLDCFVEEGVDPSPGNDQLTVSWFDETTGNRSQFTLTRLNDVRCSDDPAIPNPPGSEFDTVEGSARGNCRTPDGRQMAVDMTFRFTDAGAGGAQDRAEVTTTAAPGTNPPPDLIAVCVYDARGFLDAGDHQVQP